MIRKYTIYVVDKNRFNLLAISRKLKDSFNCKTQLFTDPAECLEMLASSSADLVLSEYQLNSIPLGVNSLNGKALQKSIHKIDGQLPVILYSSLSGLKSKIQDKLVESDNFIPMDEQFLSNLANKVKDQLVDIRERMKTRSFIYFGAASIIAATLTLITFSYFKNFIFLYLLVFAFWILALFNFVIEPLHIRKPILKSDHSFS